MLTGLFAGAAIALHPVVGCWFLIGLGLATIAELFSVRWISARAIETTIGRRIVQVVVMTLAAVFAALPGLIPGVRLLSESTLSAEDRGTADRIQVFVRLNHHLDPTRFPANAWLHAGTLLVCVLAGSWWLWKPDRRPVLLRVLLLLASAIVIAAVGVAIGWHRGSVADLPEWSGRAFLLKFYPFRFVDALLPVITSLMLAVVAMDSLPQKFQQARWIAGLVVLVLAAAFVTRQNTPGGYSAAAYADWQDACDWIRQNTPTDSLISTPRESFAFKWFAERSEYVCYKDCPQDSAGILRWHRRLQAVAWLDLHRQDGSLTPTDLQRLREETGVNYLITRRFTVEDSTLQFENSTWRIYDLRSPEMPSRPK